MNVIETDPVTCCDDGRGVFFAKLTNAESENYRSTKFGSEFRSSIFVAGDIFEVERGDQGPEKFVF